LGYTRYTPIYTPYIPIPSIFQPSHDRLTLLVRAQVANRVQRLRFAEPEPMDLGLPELRPWRLKQLNLRKVAFLEHMGTKVEHYVTCIYIYIYIYICTSCVHIYILYYIIYIYMRDVFMYIICVYSTQSETDILNWHGCSICWPRRASQPRCLALGTIGIAEQFDTI
jgi:hypothetical protein